MNCKNEEGKLIYYELFGKDTGPTIIFLNGLTQATNSWALVTPYFKENYRILLMDFIFQGKSDKEGSWRDFDAHARDVKSLLDHLEIDTVIMVGISYGSLVAQHFALSYPNRLKSLVLISTFAHKTPYYEAVELAWWRALEHGGYNLMLDIMLPSVLSEQYFENPLIPIQSMKEARQMGNQNSDAIFKLMRATKERPDYRHKLRGVSTNTLIIQGEKDLLFPVKMAEEVQKNILGSRLEVIKNAGHTLNLEHVPEVCEHIMRFIR